jgi:hypothetical protein
MTTPRPFLAAAVMLASLLALACGDDEPVGPVGITRIQAFYCTIRGQEECSTTGEVIPDDSLPPVDEAFMVWAWHAGFNTTRWLLISPVATDSISKLAQDSVGSWIRLNGAEAKDYTLKIQIMGPENVVITEDSLVWEYP